MKRKWLEDYAMVPKALLVILFFFWLGGAIIFEGLKETSTYNSKLDTVLRPPEYGGPKFEDWQQRKALVQKEIEIINKEAKAQGTKYNIVSYFTDMNRIMDLEDKYHLDLTSGMQNAVEGLQVYFYKSPDNTKIPEAQETMIKNTREKFEQRHGLGKSGPVNWSKVLPKIFIWLIFAYLKLIFFWFLIYLIRFEEDDKYQGLSIKDELIICPSRFLLRILLWPRWCLAYPYHEDTAEAMRYLKLKARFLQNKPFGYQFSENDETWLKKQARAPIKEFEKAIKDLREFEAPQLVKKSLATAYLSLFFGVLLQPAIVLASTYSTKINAHFYSQIQIVEVGHEAQFFDNHGADPPGKNFPAQNWLLKTAKYELEEVFLVWRLAIYFLLIKPEEIVKEIFHVPLTRLFSGAAKVF